MEAQQARCIDSAIQLCSREGLGFTMDQLAAELGMSKKTLYVLFDSKEALLLQMADAMFRQVKDSEAAVLSCSGLSLAEKVRRLVVVLPEPFKTLNWNNLRGLAQRYPQVYQRVCHHLETGWEPTLALLRQGMDEGVFRPFSTGVFRAVVEGSIEHFLTSDTLAREGTGYIEALDQMIDLLLEGILAKGGAD